MTDLKELFDMVTNKTQADPEVWKQQEELQRRTSHKRKAGAMAVAAALVVAIAVWFSTTDRRESSVVPGAVSPPPVILEPDVQDLAIVGLDGIPLAAIPGVPQDAADFDLSPDRQTIVFALTAPEGGTRIATMSVDGGEPQILTTGIPDVRRPVWSPDGTQIVFEWIQDGQSDLYVMDADGSNVRQLTDDADNDAWPRWAPDGASIVYSTMPSDEFDAQFAQTGDIWSIPSGGGEPTQLTTAPGPDAYPDVSPDGTQIVYFHDDGIWVMGVDGSDPRLLEPVTGFVPRWSPDGSRIAYGTYDEAYRPKVSFGVPAREEGEPLNFVNVLEVDSGDGGRRVGEARMVYDLNAPMWWSDDQLLIHRVGTIAP